MYSIRNQKHLLLDLINTITVKDKIAEAQSSEVVLVVCCSSVANDVKMQTWMRFSSQC